MKTKEKRAPHLVESRALGILAGAAVVAVGIFFLILPRVNALRPGGELDVAAARAELARLQTLVRSSESRASSLKAYGEGSASERLAILLPPAPEVPELVRGIDAAARTAGIELTTISASVRPSGKSTVNAAVSIDLTLAATDVRYEEFKKFIAALENSLRLIDIQSLAYQPDSLTLSVKAAAYALNPTASPTGTFDERALKSGAFDGLEPLTAPHAIPTPSGGRPNPFATSTFTP